MKLKILLLSIFIVPALIGCGNVDNENHKLTFGTYAHRESIEITGDELLSKLESENFLVAVHPEKGSCSCWTLFENVLNSVSKRFNLLSYKVLYSEINDTLYNNGNGFLRLDDTPTFYIVLNGKINKRFIYPKTSNYDEDLNLFFNEDSLYRVVKKYAILPTLYYVDENKLNTLIKGNALVYFVRNTCPDCNYCTPNVLKTYLANKEFDEKIYVFDLDIYYYSDKQKYQEIKDKYSLSNKDNTKFGYDTGYVPTFQVYNNGELTSACVYFNDTVIKTSDNKYIISSSYYSKERINYLSYTTTVLDGLEIDKENIIEYPEYDYISIKNQYHASLYDPILISFLDMYLK